MKRKIAAFLLVVVFNFSNILQVLALPPPEDFPCLCCPIEGFRIDCIPPDFLLAEDLEIAIGKFSQALKELSKSSKVSLPITFRMNSLLKKIKNVLRLDANKCGDLVNVSLSRIESLFNKLQNKKCPSGHLQKCIEEEVLNQFLPSIQESLDQLKSILNIDDDDTGIPDVCRG